MTARPAINGDAETAACELRQVRPHGRANPLKTNLSKREIPSLNGLRGIAALLVVIWHYLDAWHLSSLFPGPFAVTLFFELSGLLITWLILSEVEATGRFHARQFYARRALRLFPVFYVVWGLCRSAGPFAGDWAYFFYLGDYFTALTQRYSILTAAWSLGVEEKFYLLWPLILMRLGRAIIPWALAAVLLLEPAYRLTLSHFGLRTYTWFAFDARLDPIVLGCLLAWLVKRGWVAPRWIAHGATPICALLLVLLLQRFSDIVTYLLAVILLAVIARPVALLNNRAVRYLGMISYPLYLSHGYAHNIVWHGVFGRVRFHSVAVELSTQLLCALAVATALHFGVERPFLQLKNRFHGSRDESIRPHK